MQLDELIGVKSQLGQDDAYLGNLMKKYGFQEIGSGSRSRVYQNAKGVVVKIFRQYDQAYKDWVLFAIKNKDNPHFPRITGKPVKIDRYYAIRLEPLRELTPHYKWYGTLKSLYDILDRKNNWQIILNANPDTKEMFAEFPQLKSALMALKRLRMRNPDYELDISTYNTMLRGDTPVITDPLFM